MHTSTRPSYGVGPPTNRRAPVSHCLDAVYHIHNAYYSALHILAAIPQAWQCMYMVV